MRDRHKTFVIIIFILILVGLAGIMVASLMSDVITSREVFKKDIAVIGKICGEEIFGSTKSTIQDSDGIVYSVSIDNCKHYEIGSNYTIRYNHIRSGLSGIQYNIEDEE
jgi:hypothetical protein